MLRINPTQVVTLVLQLHLLSHYLHRLFQLRHEKTGAQHSVPRQQLLPRALKCLAVQFARKLPTHLHHTRAGRIAQHFTLHRRQMVNVCYVLHSTDSSSRSVSSNSIAIFSNSCWLKPPRGKSLTALSFSEVAPAVSAVVKPCACDGSRIAASSAIVWLWKSCCGVNCKPASLILTLI